MIYVTYSIYVVKKLIDLNEPFCPFDGGGYCDVPTKQKKEECLKCDISRKAFEKEKSQKIQHL